MAKIQVENAVGRQVTALFEMLASLLGPDKLVLKAGKLDALSLMRSKSLPKRMLALQRLVFEDPTIDKLPALSALPGALAAVEEELEKKVGVKMAERHRDYIKDLKLEALKEDGGPETSSTLKKKEELD